MANDILITMEFWQIIGCIILFEVGVLLLAWLCFAGQQWHNKEIPGEIPRNAAEQRGTVPE